MKDLKQQIKREVQEVRKFLMRMSAANTAISDEDILCYVTNAHKPLTLKKALALAEVRTHGLPYKERAKVIRKFGQSVRNVDKSISSSIGEKFYA